LILLLVRILLNACRRLFSSWTCHQRSFDARLAGVAQLGEQNFWPFLTSKKYGFGQVGFGQ
jgi:hypothetical protein